MRKIPASLAVLAVVAVGLVGCSQPGADACPRPTASAPAALDLVDVSGSLGSVPDVEVFTPFHTAESVFGDVVTGDGTAITTDAQLVVLDVSISSGETGENLISTAYDGDLTRAFPLSSWAETLPPLEDALQCATEGSRVVVALAPGDVEEQTAASLGLEAGDSAVAVVDVRKVYLAAANGAPQFNNDRGLPTVVRAPDGRPGIIVPEATAPEDLVIQTILKGTGPEVTGADPVRVHYTGVLWDGGTVFDTTWDDAPKSITLEDVVPGLAEALSGQTVGSQVMVVVPPDQGYGDEAQASVPAGSTLVYVVDILGIDDTPAG